MKQAEEAEHCNESYDMDESVISLISSEDEQKSEQPLDGDETVQNNVSESIMCLAIYQFYKSALSMAEIV